MKLTLETLRTPAERVWLTLAVLFSGSVWLSIVAAYGFVFFYTPSPLPICYYEEYDYDVEEYYYTYDVVTDPSVFDLDECLAEEVIPSDMVTEANAEALAAALTNKIGGIFASFVPLIYIGAFFTFIYISTALTMAYIRLNALRLDKNQYPEFYEVYVKAAQKLGLQRIPPAYIIDADGAANAFAIKIAHKRMVVFFAELVDRLIADGKLDELEAVAAHELTHVKLGHIHWWFALLPFNMLPFSGKALSRAREYSADRGALFVTENVQATSMALLKLVLGVRIAKIANVPEYITASSSERGIFATLARLSGTHPPIPERIRALEQL